MIRVNWSMLVVGFLLVLLFAATFDAFAASYTVTCDPPTERTDGTPLTPAEIAEYKFLVDGTLDGTSTACSYLVNRPAGTYEITAVTVDTGGLESPASPPFPLTLIQSPPMAPTGLR